MNFVFASDGDINLPGTSGIPANLDDNYASVVIPTLTIAGQKGKLHELH